MAKYQEPFEETQDLFTEIITAAGLAQVLNITVLVDNNSKKLFEVIKANNLLKHLAASDVVIVINERILEKLTPAQRRIVVEESITPITYDNETDKLTINKPDVITHSGVLSKHTFKVWNDIRETVKLLYKAEEDAKEEAKAVRTPTNKPKAFAKSK